MTTVAGSTEYSREYQRRRAAGLPTVGLAAAIREGTLVPQLPVATLRQGQMLYAAGASTSRVMARLSLSYAEAQTIRASLE